jgi:hypothetical protein
MLQTKLAFVFSRELESRLAVCGVNDLRAQACLWLLAEILGAAVVVKMLTWLAVEFEGHEDVTPMPYLVTAVCMRVQCALTSFENVSYLTTKIYDLLQRYKTSIQSQSAASEHTIPT